MNMQERATLRDLFDAVEDMHKEVNERFDRLDQRLTPVEHYVTADKARNESARAFRAGLAKVTGIIISIIGVAIAAAGLILALVRLVLHI